MLRKQLQSGKVIESFILNERQFDRACMLYEKEGMRTDVDSLESVELLVEEWIDVDSPLEVAELEWLKKVIREGADIYTYRDGWQSIGEIAVKEV